MCDEENNNEYWTSTPKKIHDSYLLERFLNVEEDVISHISISDDSSPSNCVRVKYIGTVWATGPSETSDKSVQTEADIRESCTSTISTQVSFSPKSNLFQGCAFLVAKPFSRFTQAQVEQALQYHGGKVSRDPKEFKELSDLNNNKICIIGELNYYQQDINKQALRKKLGPCICLKLHYTWILDSLLNYRLAPMAKYFFDIYDDIER